MKILDKIGKTLTEIFMESSRPKKALPERTLEMAQHNFFRAIEHEDIDTIRRITTQYRDFNTWRDEGGRSPLYAAQSTNSFASFVELVAQGADRQEDYGNGWTPLLTAMYRGDTHYGEFFTDFLLDSKTSNINSFAKRGDLSFTPLHLAVMHNDEERVLYMIERNVDQNVKARPHKKFGEVTAEELATLLKRPKLAEMLRLADDIREVKRREWAELGEYAKKNRYVPRPDDDAPAVVVPDDDKKTTIVVDKPKPAAPN
jgi:ankyrin repeat protein